jgi:hypothetical protein
LIWSAGTRTVIGMSGSWAAQLAVTFRSELIAADADNE